MKDRRGATRSLGEAKAHLAECVRAAEGGQAIVLTRHGRPVARLLPYGEPRGGRGEVREHQADYPAQPPSPFEDEKVRRATLRRLLEREIWPRIPSAMIGRAPSKQEREQILGLGEESS